MVRFLLFVKGGYNLAGMLIFGEVHVICLESEVIPAMSSCQCGLLHPVRFQLFVRGG